MSLKEVIVLAGSGKKLAERTAWWDPNLTVWGHGTSDSGSRGYNKGSLHIDDFAGMSSKKLNWKFLNAWLRYFRFGLGGYSKGKKIKERFPNKSTMEDKVDQEAKNVPKNVKVVIRKPVVIIPADGNSGVRVNTVTDTIFASRKDSARISNQAQAVIDSIYRSYE